MTTSATAAWSDPKLSIGRKCAQVKRKTVWEAKGPALEKFENEIFKGIRDLLDAHKEHLELGEQISRTYSFHLWMVGRDEESAVPTIIFTSKSATLREKVIKLIKKHEILTEFEGFALKSMDRMPAITMGPLEVDDVNSILADGEINREEDSLTVGASIYTRGQPIDVCGSIILTKDGDEMTLGGVIIIPDDHGNDECYGIIALHPQEAITEETGETKGVISRDSELRFDEDSDMTSIATASLRQVPSMRSIRDPSLDLSRSLSYHSLSSARLDEKRLSWLGYSANSISRTASTITIINHTETLETPHQIGTMAVVSTGSGLHYGIFRIEDPRYGLKNRIRLPNRSPNGTSYLYPEALAPEVQEGEVWVATGKSGLIKGLIIKNPYFIKLAGSEVCQKMWPVQLEQNIVPGDCGSWVLDACSGNLYGHIIAGDSTLRRAYMIEANLIFKDIKDIMNADAFLPANNFSNNHFKSSEDYRKIVAYRAGKTNLNSLDPGHHYKALSEYLDLSLKPKAVNNGNAINNSSPIHVAFYDIKGYKPLKSSQFKDSSDFESYIDKRASAATSSLLFMKGFSSPEWILAIGSQFQIDPEFFRSHLSFTSPQNYFELPCLSTRSNAITLRLTTLGRFDCRTGDIEIWRKQRAELVQSCWRRVEGLEIGDSVIRDFSVFDGDQFAIEQDVSIILTTKDKCWTTIIWSDIGHPLPLGPMASWILPPILHFDSSKEGYLLPVIPTRLGNGLRYWEENGLSNETLSDEPIDYIQSNWSQSAAALPMEYGRRLRPEIMKQDAVYSLVDVFTWTVASESQFLNFLETQIENISQNPEIAAKKSLSELQYFRAIIERHSSNLKQVVSTLERGCGPNWPRAQDPNFREIADAAIDDLVRDHKCLVERAEVLSRRCESSMSLVMKMSMLQEQQRALEDSRNFKTIILLAIIFLPSSFASSLFGMNVSEFGIGSVHIWIPFLTLVSVFFGTFVFWRMVEIHRRHPTYIEKSIWARGVLEGSMKREPFWIFIKRF